MYSSPAIANLRYRKFEQKCTIITLSGFALPEYGYKLFFEAMRAFPMNQLLVCICVYGENSNQIYEYVPPSVADQVVVLKQLTEHAFSEILRLSDLYVRPNLVDSFGIAVADAIGLGTTVIASDVCERAPGAILFKTGSAESLQAAIRTAIARTSNASVPDEYLKFCEHNIETLLSVFVREAD